MPNVLVIGALFFLWLFDSILGFMAIIGSMGLVGIAINDSIMVLSSFNEDKQAKKSDPKTIREVVIKATRHVLTTTVMMGFAPLLLEGDPFWQPLAIAGGIAGSSVMALYFVRCNSFESLLLLLEPDVELSD